jgi:predicted Rossmann fold flavoprotein
VGRIIFWVIEKYLLHFREFGILWKCTLFKTQFKVMRYDVIILGGGAAGLFCAIEAGKRGRRVAVLEHNTDVGKKIRISGGGKCNFTNRVVGPENFISENPSFAASALRRFTPDDIIALLERHAVDYFEKEKGQLFCRHSSRQILGILQAECDAAGVKIITGCAIGPITRNSLFRCMSSLGDFEAESLVVATGGLSLPPLGATSLGYRLAEQFGLAMIPPRPGLVPLTWNEADRRQFGKLSGISFPVIATAGSAAFDGNILFTHQGISGPAILQISSYWKTGNLLSLDLLPGMDILSHVTSMHQTTPTLKKILAKYLPPRFLAEWGKGRHLEKPICEISHRVLTSLAGDLKRWEIMPAGTEGFARAEVTCGGIDTRELSSKTMETKKIPRLYCIGEVVDVTGWLGGYNFQWAWSSGFAAGQYV